MKFQQYLGKVHVWDQPLPSLVFPNISDICSNICSMKHQSKTPKVVWAFKIQIQFLRSWIQCKFNMKWSWLQISTEVGLPRWVKNIAFSPAFHLQTFMAVWRHDSKTKLGPSERQNDRKKILTECLLSSTAEFHTQLSSKVSGRKRLCFEFKMKFCSWTLLYNNVTVGFHVHLNALQIKWTPFHGRKMLYFFPPSLLFFPPSLPELEI